MTGLAPVLVERALLSVSDKRGLLELARGLVDRGVQLIATGGTLQTLTGEGIEVTPTESVTGAPELLGGRVKTLHPTIHAGILARRDRSEDQEDLEALGVGTIDLVVVNLYPFEASLRGASSDERTLLEMIDIGGPTLLRAAAKNWPYVAVLCDPDDYGPFLAELEGAGGAVGPETRLRLAAKAFWMTGHYDGTIGKYFQGVLDDVTFPPFMAVALTKLQDLRYGENPHQGAALYRAAPADGGLAVVEQLQGKPLSFNNLLDVAGSWGVVQEFAGQPACAVIKHTSPAGVGLGTAPGDALEKAWACDPLSAFGGVVAFNREVDQRAAEFLREQFVEVVAAPGFEEGAKAQLAGKQALRLLRLPEGGWPPGAGRWDLRSVQGGVLVQEWNTRTLPSSGRSGLRVVTTRAPSEEEWEGLMMAWRVVKHVKSNAIVLARADRTIGIGCGQMSRVDAARLAVQKAEAAQLPIEGAVAASDAFFPFPDGPEILADAGVTAIIQPGGSRRDEEVIEAAESRGLAMVFTGLRQFRH